MWEYSWSLHAKETGISSDLMGCLAHISFVTRYFDNTVKEILIKKILFYRAPTQVKGKSTGIFLEVQAGLKCE